MQDQNFAAADRRFTRRRDAFPERAEGNVWCAEAALALEQNADAAQLLTIPTDCPMQRNEEIAVKRYAALASARLDWAVSAKRWKFMSDRHTMHPSGYVGQLEALREHDDWTEAGPVLQSAQVMFPVDGGVAIEGHYIAKRVRTISRPDH